MLDILDFLAEQIELSRSDFDRAAAIDAARGAVPLLNSRLWENPIIGSLVALSPVEPWFLSPHWRENWNTLITEASNEFGKSVDSLIGNL